METRVGAAQHSTTQFRLRFALFRVHMGIVVLLIGISRERSRRITNAIESSGACTHFWICCFCPHRRLSLLSVERLYRPQAHTALHVATKLWSQYVIEYFQFFSFLIHFCDNFDVVSMNPGVTVRSSDRTSQEILPLS